MLLAEAALAARAIFAVLDVPLAGSCAARCHAARYGVAHGRGGSQVGNAAPRRVALRRVASRCGECCSDLAQMHRCAHRSGSWQGTRPAQGTAMKLRRNLTAAALALTAAGG